MKDLETAVYIANRNSGVNCEKSCKTFTRCRKNLLTVLLISILMIYYLLWPSVFRQFKLVEFDLRHPRTLSSSLKSSRYEHLVPLEAHIMSKCPDAQDCLKMMVLPTMEKVSGKVNFTLSFIGTPTINDGVDCMHGPEECMGDIVELCAAEVYPDPKIYLGFTMCLTQDYKEIPDRDLLEDCALEYGIDFKKLNDCASLDDGDYGIELLRKSVRHSKQVGVTKSCTVRLNEEIYCIRDGGEWTDCQNGAAVEDLVSAIEDLYQKSLLSLEDQRLPPRAQ